MDEDFNVIFIFDPDKIKRLELDDSGRKLLRSKDVRIVRYDPQNKNEFQEYLDSRGLYQRNSVLIRSPYDKDNFQQSADAQLAFAIEKYMCFTLFCGLLGAKEVYVEQIVEENSLGKVNYDLRANSLEAKGNLSYENSQVGMLKSRIESHHIFTGGRPQIIEAEDLLRTRRLLGDGSMKSLLEMRRQEINPIQSSKLNIKLSTESKNILKAVGNIEFPLYLTDLAGEMNRHRERTSDFTLTVTVNF